MSDAVIGKVVDGYRIQAVIGRGGMGTVYRAEDVNLSRTVALKRINPSQSDRESFIHRFRSEAQALARIDSPHIVGVYALRETDIGLLIVMEYVSGGTLKVPLERQGPMALEEAVPIFEQVMRAVHDAHSAGVVHRDIKPQNILLTQDGLVKVTDFGIAKLRQPDSGETVTQGGRGGTLKYMSPEQISDISAVDARSDLYSIGMTAYEMLAGDLPFEASDTDFDIMRKVVEGEIPPPDALNPEIPPVLVQWVMDAIRTQQDERYQSAEAMLEALRTADRQVEATGTRPGGEADDGEGTEEGADSLETRAVPSDVDDDVPTETTDADEAGETETAAEGETTRNPGSDEEGTATAPGGPDAETQDAAPSETGVRWAAVVGGAAAALLVAVAVVLTVSNMGGSGASATLSLTTTPSGATVLVNGDTAGTTPLNGYALEAGAVQLQVEKDGYRPVDSSFAVENGGQIALGDVSLARTTDEPEGADRTADAETTSPPDEENPADDNPTSEARPDRTGSATGPQTEATAEPLPNPSDEPDAAPATGTVEVAAQPVGTVEVDGASRQDSSVELTEGEHTVTCRHPSGVSVDTTLTVAAGETQRLACHTEMTVNVTTTGAWGRVWLNGQNTEVNTNTGESLSLSPGSHRVEVRKRSDDDFQVEGGVVQIERGENSRKVDFSGSTYELEVAPGFEQVEHAVVFDVGGT